MQLAKKIRAHTLSLITITRPSIHCPLPDRYLLVSQPETSGMFVVNRRSAPDGFRFMPAARSTARTIVACFRCESAYEISWLESQTEPMDNSLNENQRYQKQFDSADAWPRSSQKPRILSRCFLFLHKTVMHRPFGIARANRNQRQSVAHDATANPASCLCM